MVITNIRKIPAGKYLFISVETSEGIQGIGEIGVWGYLDSAAALLDQVAQDLLGKDPMKIEHHWNWLYRRYYFRGTVIMSVISALDIAMWDIKGKKLGVPIYELLGGRTRDKMRCYAPVAGRTIEEMADGCRKRGREGFTAARLMLSYLTDDHVENHKTYSGKVSLCISCVQECRKIMGNDFDLILEVHRGMTVAEAIAFGRGVENCHPLFLEDPIPPDSIPAMAHVANHINIPIATGERAINMEEIETLLMQNGAQYIRPDVCVVGGITAAKKIAAVAQAHYAGIVPHNPLGPVSTAACLQLDMCIPNFTIQEYPSFNLDGNENGMLKTPLQTENGFLYALEQPGLGIELISDLMEKYPADPRSASVRISYDGSVSDR